MKQHDEQQARAVIFNSVQPAKQQEPVATPPDGELEDAAAVVERVKTQFCCQ